MKLKFSSLLDKNKKWNVTYNSENFNSVSMAGILSAIITDLDDAEIKIDKESYVIGVGYNSIEYFILIMLASVLGIRLILCDPKMLSTLIAEYKLPYSCVISTRNILTDTVPLFKISINPYVTGCDDALKKSTQQAELIFFTSGTTSMPKLVVYEEATLLANSDLVGKYFGITSGDRCLCLFPVNYMYGFSMLMSTILQGGEVILERPTISSQEIWEYLINKKIRILPIIHSILDGLSNFINNLDVTKKYFEDLIIVNASDKIYSEDVSRALDICPVFWNNFGQTEAGPRIFGLKLTDKNTIKQYSHNGVVALGKVVDPAICLNIVNQDGITCAPHEVGSLHYDSPYKMKGYIDVQGKLIVKSTLDSGDLVYLSDDGVVYWVARKNEVIKINGRFVNVSLLHQKFDRSGIVRKSYFVVNQDQQKINAIFVPHSTLGVNDGLRESIAKCYKKLFPNYPRLSNIVFIDELPTTLSGKVKLREIENLFTQ